MCRSYKVHELTTNIPNISHYYNPSMCGSSGMVMSNDHTLWITNCGNSTTARNVVHLNTSGEQLSDPLPFIDYISPDPLVVPSQQRQLITDLLWLQKNVLYVRDYKIMKIPKIYNIPPILGLAGKQPSSAQTSLNSFLNKPNGYLGPHIDISYLINFCIQNPLPLKTASGKKATAILSNAHYIIYPTLLLDLFNQSIITQYGNTLVQAQKWIILSSRLRTQNLSESNPDPEIQLASKNVQTIVTNDQLPIGLCYNKSRGFVGYPFGGKRVSCDLIAVSPSGSIYVYSPLINTGIYYGMITVLNNSGNFAVYTGVTMSSNNIYIADFNNMRIDMYDFGWIANRDAENLFVDPNLPTDYTPYNVFAHNNVVYVLYAKIDLTSGPSLSQPVFGKGCGIINEFSLDGKFIRRAYSGGPLNAPWGITIIRNEFADGRFMISNHGDGHILIFDQNWKYLYKLHYKNYNNSIIGLFSIYSVDDSVFFTSAPNGIESGLFGQITKGHHNDLPFQEKCMPKECYDLSDCNCELSTNKTSNYKLSPTSTSNIVEDKVSIPYQKKSIPQISKQLINHQRIKLLKYYNGLV